MSSSKRNIKARFIQTILNRGLADYGVISGERMPISYYNKLVVLLVAEE